MCLPTTMLDLIPRCSICAVIPIQVTSPSLPPLTPTSLHPPPPPPSHFVTFPCPALQAAAWLMCIVKFLVWLLEKIVAFINRNAYIMVAVKG